MHLLGFAPGRVYPATDITAHAGGLLHHRFTLANAEICRFPYRNTLLCCTRRQISLPGC